MIYFRLVDSTFVSRHWIVDKAFIALTYSISLIYLFISFLFRKASQRHSIDNGNSSSFDHREDFLSIGNFFSIRFDFFFSLIFSCSVVNIIVNFIKFNEKIRRKSWKELIFIDWCSTKKKTKRIKAKTLNIRRVRLCFSKRIQSNGNKWWWWWWMNKRKENIRNVWQ